MSAVEKIVAEVLAMTGWVYVPGGAMVAQHSAGADSVWFIALRLRRPTGGEIQAFVPTHKFETHRAARTAYEAINKRLSPTNEAE